MAESLANQCSLMAPEVTSELLSGAPTDCEPREVEQRFGVVGCRTQGGLLRSAMRTGPWMDDGAGHQQAGSLAVLLDHALAEKFYAARSPGQRVVTTELAFDVVVPPPWTTTALHAICCVPQAEPTGGFAHGEVVDDRGTLIAVGRVWMQYLPTSGSHVAVEQDIPQKVEWPTATSLAEHLGVRVCSSRDGARVELTEPQRWNSQYGVLHGGVWASLVELAATSVLARYGELRTAHVHVSYLRAAAAGPVVLARAHPVHAGRSFGLVEVAGFDDSGRHCISATVTGRAHATP